MRMIKAGHAPARCFRFTCVWCGSVVEADKNELEPDIFDRNERYYRFDCPICNKSRIVADHDMKAVGPFD